MNTKCVSKPMSYLPIHISLVIKTIVVWRGTVSWHL